MLTLCTDRFSKCCWRCSSDWKPHHWLHPWTQQARYTSCLSLGRRQSRIPSSCAACSATLRSCATLDVGRWRGKLFVLRGKEWSNSPFGEELERHVSLLPSMDSRGWDTGNTSFSAFGSLSTCLSAADSVVWGFHFWSWTLAENKSEGIEIVSVPLLFGDWRWALGAHALRMIASENDLVMGPAIEVCFVCVFLDSRAKSKREL